MTIGGTPTEFCEGCNKINDKNLCIVYNKPEEHMSWVTDSSIRTGCGFNYPNLFKKGLVEDRRGSDRMRFVYKRR
jgi:hypothetical protein